MLFVVCLLGFPDRIYAGLGSSDFQLNGFFTQSYIKTDNNNFLGNSTGKGSIDYREMGINASVKLSSRLQFASQLLSRYAGKTDSGDVKLDFLLADYRMLDKRDYGLGISVGRVKNPFGFYNETRDVSFTRESIILPQSIYFERTRDISVSSDGIHFYAHKQTRLGLVNGRMVTAIPRVTDLNTEYALLGDNRPGMFIAKPSFVGRLLFESNDSRFVAAYSHVGMNMDYRPAASEGGGIGDVNFEMKILSLKYNLMRWSFTSEYAQRKISANAIAYIPAVVNNKTGESFYLQSIYRFNHKWRMIARYDVLYSDKNDRDGEAVAGLIPIMNYSRYAKDIMLGIQFTVNRHWMTRLELHRIDGTAWLPKQDNPDASKTVQKWDMLNASISYRF